LADITAPAAVLGSSALLSKTVHAFNTSQLLNMLLLVGNGITTTPQQSSMQKIVGNFKKGFGSPHQYTPKSTSQSPL
jgi:hypothetical protein